MQILLAIKDHVSTILAALAALSIVIEVAPIKINPWSRLAENISKAFNKPALDKITSVEQQLRKTNEKLAETNEKLDGHTANDELQKAEDARAAALRFNNELLRNIPHTREEFFEVLQKIDIYEEYCDKHKDYENNRAVHAIANINRVYDERLAKHDFLSEISDTTKEQGGVAW